MIMSKMYHYLDTTKQGRHATEFLLMEAVFKVVVNILNLSFDV